MSLKDHFQWIWDSNGAVARQIADKKNPTKQERELLKALKRNSAARYGTGPRVRP
jgi:hypothetical protein